MIDGGCGAREFAGWDSFSRFARQVRFTSRYVWGEEERAFLETVLATTRDRDVVFREGHTFYRAQLGVDFIDQTDDEGNWIDIDNAFSEPVTSTDDRADYAPTQILAELFRSAGYEAIGYKSQFGDEGDKRGYNIAIFDPEAVEIVACAPYKVRSIKVEAEQNGNPWSRKRA
jgi:hypothetical protein